MKKYIAFSSNKGNGISSTGTKDAAIDWATRMLNQNATIAEVTICEVIGTVSRQLSPTIFIPVEDDVVNDKELKSTFVV